ncbi:LOW QUALITY PROTEIN: uncharacterized protein Dvir_GJ26838, partial [Drosophila virilis]
MHTCLFSLLQLQVPRRALFFVYARQAQVDNAPSCPAYVRPNKLQGHYVTCRNFQSTLSNAIKSCWTCRNINLTFYCPGRGPRKSIAEAVNRNDTGQRLPSDSCQGCFICESYGKQLLCKLLEYRKSHKTSRDKTNLMCLPNLIAGLANLICG